MQGADKQGALEVKHQYTSPLLSLHRKPTTYFYIHFTTPTYVGLDSSGYSAIKKRKNPVQARSSISSLTEDHEEKSYAISLAACDNHPSLCLIPQPCPLIDCMSACVLSDTTCGGGKQLMLGSCSSGSYKNNPPSRCTSDIR